MQALREQARHGGRVLITGGTGYLGALMLADMLRLGWADHVVVPSRRPVEGGLPPELVAELQAQGLDVEAQRARITLVPWGGAEASDRASLRALLVEHAIDSVVHCAGCLDYFNAEALQAINVEFTRALTEAAHDAQLRFFAFISTAYAAGYSNAPVPEALLPEPPNDPTQYTATKRQAEHIVASADVPWMILRPSIVIGSAQDGRYSGKRYGLYQQWMGVERLLTDRYHETLHAVATEQPLNLLHQDAFQRSVSMALQWLPDGAVMNIVTGKEGAPHMKDLWLQLCEITRPHQIIFYASMDEVDLKAIPLRQRAYLSFAQTNLEIGAYGWTFERGWLQRLKAERGLQFEDTSVATIQTCLDRFLATSEPFRQYVLRFSAQMSEHTTVRAPSDPVAQHADAAA